VEGKGRKGGKGEGKEKGKEGALEPPPKSLAGYTGLRVICSGEQFRL